MSGQIKRRASVRSRPEPFKAYVLRVLDAVRCKLYLHEYRMFIRLDADAEFQNPESMAEISICGTYLEFTVKLSERLRDWYKRGQLYNVVTVLVHELCHVLTEPLYVIAVDAVTNTSLKYLHDTRERQTQRICNVVLGMLDEGEWR